MDVFNPTTAAPMGEEQFHLLRDFIYEKSAIFFADNKKSQLESRLNLRMRANNLTDYDKYYYLLKYDPQADSELQSLFDSVSTNETSFFRSPPQIQALRDIALPQIMAAKSAAGERRLRLWSAGCSTGEEPYTMAIVLKECLGAELANWDIRILGSDISEKALQSARDAVYNEYTLRTAPQVVKDSYFTREDGRYRINEDIRSLVEFQFLNFSDAPRISLMRDFDIIFCRNVLIYFDDTARKRFVEQLHESLHPGGFLFIGHSESLHNISRAFKLVHFPGALGYRKE